MIIVLPTLNGFIIGNLDWSKWLKKHMSPPTADLPGARRRQ